MASFVTQKADTEKKIEHLQKTVKYGTSSVAEGTVPKQTQALEIVAHGHDEKQRLQSTGRAPERSDEPGTTLHPYRSKSMLSPQQAPA